MRQLAQDEVHVWYGLTESLDEAGLREARALLSAEERLRHDRYRMESDRRDYAAAHALLRRSLSCYRDIEPQAWAFNAGVGGKPQLSIPSHVDAQLSFNLSHTPGCVACAIAPAGDVGIDVERTDRIFDVSPIVSRYFAPAEIARLDGADPHDRFRRFIELWALKEAFAKVTGAGLTDALPGFGFQLDDDRIEFLPPPDVDAAAWQFALIELSPHYRMALAVCGCDARTWTVMTPFPDACLATVAATIPVRTSPPSPTRGTRPTS